MQQRSSSSTRSSRTRRSSRSEARQSAKIYRRLQWNLITTISLVCIAVYILSLAFYYNGRFFRQALLPQINTPENGEVYFNRQIYGLGAFKCEKSYIKWGEHTWIDELYLDNAAFYTSPWAYLFLQTKLIPTSAIQSDKATIRFKPQFTYVANSSSNTSASTNKASTLFPISNKHFKSYALSSQEHELHIPDQLRLKGEQLHLKRLSHESAQVDVKNTDLFLHKHRQLTSTIESISGVLMNNVWEAQATNLQFKDHPKSKINADFQLDLAQQTLNAQAQINTTPISLITKAKHESAWLQGSLSNAKAELHSIYLADEETNKEANKGSIQTTTQLSWQNNPSLVLNSAGLKLIESKLIAQSSVRNLATCSGTIHKSPTEFKGSITDYQSNYDYRIKGEWHLDYTKHPNGALTGTMQLGLPRRDAKRILTKEAYAQGVVDQDNAYRWVTFELSGFLHNAKDNIKSLIKP